MTVKKSNKMIAVFMGIYAKKGLMGWTLYHDDGSIFTSLSTWTESQAWDCLNKNKRMYHNSWDWLMPVIQKIRNPTIRVPLMDLNPLVKGDINGMYNEVIKSITIYNEVKK